MTALLVQRGRFRRRSRRVARIFSGGHGRDDRYHKRSNPRQPTVAPGVFLCEQHRSQAASASRAPPEYAFAPGCGRKAHFWSDNAATGR